MLFVDGRENKKGAQVSGEIPQFSPVNSGPLSESFSPTPPTTAGLFPSTAETGPVVTRSLQNVSQSPNLTVNLPETIQTGPLVMNKAVGRSQVVIRGTGKRTLPLRPPARRAVRKSHWMLHLGVMMVISGIILGALLTFAPVAQGNTSLLTASTSTINQTKAQNTDNQLLMAQRIATPTSAPISKSDGYDPNLNNMNGNTASTSQQVQIDDTAGSTAGNFPYGQCTYWSAYHYHEVSGHWVTWNGDAWMWRDGAASAGWVVSSTPHVPSIIVLQQYTQGTQQYGHVAVVESINSDGSVVTSNMNWSGGYGAVTTVTFSPGPGVSFIYHP